MNNPHRLADGSRRRSAATPGCRNWMIPLLKARLLQTLVFILLSAPATGASGGIAFDSTQSKLREGVREYSGQAFDKAEQKFLEAQGGRPDDPGIAYNLGNSYYRQGKYKDALQEYIQAASGNSGRPLKQKSLYNTGNTLFRMGKLEESALAFKKALELDPSDMDAKYNLEFVREQMQKQKNSGNAPNQDEGEGKGDGDPTDNDGTNPDPGGDPGDSGAPPGSPRPGEQGPSGQAQKPPAPTPDSTPAGEKPQQTAQAESNGELTEQQAERWLGSLDENLKRFQKRKSELRAGGTAQPEKDW